MARWPHSARRTIMIVCIVILALLTTFTLTAQNDPTLVGSGIALPLLEDLAAAAEQPLSINVTGTDAGFQQFCAGEASMVAATRAINSVEDTLCVENGISYSELLVANDVVAAIVKEDDALPTCLTITDLNTMLVPSAAGTITDWSTFVEVAASDSEEAPAAPELTVYVPELLTPTYAIVDGFISGDGLRNDATVASESDIIAAVSENTGALGFVSLAAAEAAEGVRILQVNDLTSGNGCYSPSSEAFEASNYMMGTPVLLYVEASAQAGLESFLNTLTADNAAVVEAKGFVSISEGALETNAAVLSGETIDGRQFTTAETTFEIPVTLTGEIAIGGSGVGYSFVNTALTQLTSTQVELNVQYQIEGDEAGIRRLCNGEVDFVLATADMTDEQTAACGANEIVPVTIPLGTRAVVLVSNAADDYAACLTTEQIASIWSVNTEGTSPVNWNEVPGDFPDQAITLFEPALGNAYADMLVESIEPIPPLRADGNVFADSLYRAAAVANVDGGLTYMGWTDYERVVDNNQANIQLVGVDAGSGCVEPSATTIEDGTYPLSQSAQLIVAQSSLANVNVQSAIWTLFEDTNISSLQRSGFVGININQLPSVRQDLERMFTEAAEAMMPTTTDATDETATDESATDDTSTEEGTPEDTDSETTDSSAEEPTEEATAESN